VKKVLKSKITAGAMALVMLLVCLIQGAGLAHACEPYYYGDGDDSQYEFCELILAITYEDGYEQCEYECHLDIEY